MSYQVFARKYRPQTFDDVVGQDHVTRTLRNAIAQKRIAHAYLFVGPRGTGKTSTARIIAKALNCENGPTTTPCGTCPNCEQITQGRSLDVLEIDGASNNGVEQVRELRENARTAPAVSRFKVYIIDEVHMLTTAAFNALLKTLEEPPEHVKFIFATTDVQKVLPTILSRCQRFDLRRIPANLIADHLQHIARLEKIGLDDAAAAAISQAAEGGLRDAESMLDQLVAFCGDTIGENDVLSVFGLTSARTVSDLCGHMLARDTSLALALLNQQAELGKDLLRLLSDLIYHLRNLLIQQVDPSGLKEELFAGVRESLASQATLISGERLIELIDQFSLAEGRMKWAPNRKLHFEIALIRAVETLGQTNLSEVLDALVAIRQGAPPKLAPAPPAPPPTRETPKAQAAPQAPPPETIPPAVPPNPTAATRELPADEAWQCVLAELRDSNKLLHGILSSGVARDEGSTCRIFFPATQQIAIDTIQQAARRTTLEDTLAKHAGRRLRIECELSRDNPTMPAQQPAAAKDPADEFRDDPLIRKALDLFKAEILSVQ